MVKATKQRLEKLELYTLLVDSHDALWEFYGLAGTVGFYVRRLLDGLDNLVLHSDKHSFKIVQKMKLPKLTLGDLCK